MGKHVWSIAVVAAIAFACGGRVTGNCQFCFGTCVDTTTSVLDCGGCGQTCTYGQLCAAGVCVHAGPPPSSPECGDPSLRDCGQGCSDLMSDSKNCFTCGIDCGARGECNDGECVGATCFGPGNECWASRDCCSGHCSENGECL